MSKSGIKVKVEEINECLKYLYSSIDNQLDGNNVYNHLIMRNVDKINKDKHVNNYFSMWYYRFKNKNIDVFYDKNNSSFCRFECVDEDLSYNYKIYIPTDYKHICTSVNKIFDFISDNNIYHVSKVSNEIRNDDIVIRVSNESDCKKIVEFLNDDDYIQKGLIKNNCFAFADSGINLAYDEYGSYNDCLSCLIADYLNGIYKDNNKDMDDVNINTFGIYLDDVINNIDKYYNRLSSLSRVTLFKKESCNITKLIKLNLVSNDINDYYKYLDNIYYQDNVSKSNNDEDIFREIILFFMKKYGKLGFNHIYSFLNNDDSSLAKNKELYDIVISRNIDKDKCFEIAKNSNISTSNGDIMYNYIRKVILDDIINSMDIKFGDGTINIDYYINSGDNKYITSSVGDARKLVRVFNNMRIINFFNDLGVNDIYEYRNNYYIDNKKKVR